MRILVIGGGGREHALIWKLARSPRASAPGSLLCLPGNAGIASLARCLPAPSGGLADVAALADVARSERVDLTVVGPEQPLSLGLADELSRRGLAVFGASRAAARLESSKGFAKQFMSRHGIPTAPFELFDEASRAEAYLRDPARRFPIVVKADGLAAGKGVVVARDRDEATGAVRSMLKERRFGPAGDRIVIESCLRGRELSFFALTDGQSALPLATCQDYKRALDGDEGPNTGGMGACSPGVDVDPALEERIMSTIVLPAITGMAAEGTPYRGVLYAGLMLTEAGPQVLEFNARFGDPETQALMPRLAGDLLPALLAAAGVEGRLAESAASVRASEQWAACVVVASRGYPESSDPGRPIRGLQTLLDMEEVTVFHAGTTTRTGPAGRPEVITAGGRVLAVAGRGADLRQALVRAYDGVARLSFEGMQYRRDIGMDAIERLVAQGRLAAAGR